MRVKLSYTVEEEDVLEETAKIINLSADDMQQMIELFNSSQKELKAESDENKTVNINKCLDLLDKFRRSLYNVDTRLAEVIEIVRGYDNYKRSVPQAPAAASPEEEPELFGAD